MQKIKTVMLELTWRCNLACDFCYLRHFGVLNKPGAEMDLKTIAGFIESFHEKTHFYLSGGEPFLRDDIFEISALIRKKGHECGINTNGLLLDRRAALRLLKNPPDYVIFSLHGPASVHDKITGLKGTYRKVISNLKTFSALARGKTEVVVNCVINRENAGVLPAVFGAAARAGADRVIFENLQFLKTSESERGECAPITPVFGSYRLQAGLVDKGLKSIARLGGAGKTSFEVRPLMTRKMMDSYYNGHIRPEGVCPRILDSVNVEPDGSVRMCVLAARKVSSVSGFNWKKILAEKKKFISGGLPSLCARCCHRFDIFRVW